MSDRAGLKPDEKVCPFCAETIKRAAVKCRWCQSELPEAPEPASETTPETAPATTTPPVTAARTDREIATADAARPAFDGHPERDPRGGLGSRWVLTAVLAFVVVLASVVLVRQLMAQGDQAAVPEGTTPLAAGAQVESEDAKRAAMQAATSATETILSYHADSLDDDIAAAQSLLAGKMVDEYDETVDEQMREQTVQDEVSVDATVVAASVISATEHDARLLLFVNQETTGRHLDQPRADLNRVVVTVHRDEGDWKVTEMEAL